ncbi:MAG TPA: hypothetical protein ENI07_11515 [Desulfobacterales bacterium]|nr:hypothetical protein [Desulfobacterales bacterium]
MDHLPGSAKKQNTFCGKRGIDPFVAFKRKAAIIKDDRLYVDVEYLEKKNFYASFFFLTFNIIID